MVTAGLLAGAGSVQAMAPVVSFPLPHATGAATGEFPLLLPASLHQDEQARPSEAATPSLRDALLNVAEKYSAETYIPYVWGGNAAGSKAACEQCRACISQRAHLAGGKVRGSCQACKQCGMDCSHFVNRVFREAGLDFPYLPTNRLKHMSATALRKYNLVDVGHDLRLAKPGDLLLHRRHIVMLLSLRGPHVGDFIHVSRLIKHGHVGGVEVLRNTDLERYRGKVLRILRHVAIDQSDRSRKVEAPHFKVPDPRAYDLSTQRIVRAE